jgi:antibiotic biosynthesis monooxygenase (ABM) superfamily enzyme
MSPKLRLAIAVLAAAALFGGGTLVGSRQAARAAANTFGTPKTVIHISLIKWKADVPEAEKQKVLDGVKEMAAQIPGVKNVWTKAVRMQPRDFNAAFVIEFENREAANRYAESPVHEAWTKQLLAIRETSLSPQISNE